jgi:hypothetical protein
MHNDAQELVVAIDDTDSKDEGATGKLAELIAKEIAKKAAVSRVTRHQLFVHESIPYTSHNSAMAFKVSGAGVEEIFDIASSMLEEKSSCGSDPGLCIVGTVDERVKRNIIEFGKRAKVSVVQKDEALRVAQKISLTAHGGSGDGVIGALAGAGLRLSNNDGRFRGWLDIAEGKARVKDLLRVKEIDEVRSPHGPLCDDEIVRIEGKVKTVLLDNMSVLLVRMEDDVWRNLTREELKKY